MNKHFLTLSDKSKYMIFNLKGEHSITSNLKYHNLECTKLNGCSCLELKEVKSYKYLGITIDSCLNWKEHIKNLNKKLLNITRTFYLIKNMCSLKVLKTLYYAMVQSHLGYGLSCWGGAYDTNLKPTITLQKAIIRIMLKKNRMEPSCPLFKQLRILPLKKLYTLKLMTSFVNLRLVNEAPQVEDTTVNLRNPRIATVPRPHLTLFKQSFYYNAPKTFNRCK